MNNKNLQLQHHQVASKITFNNKPIQQKIKFSQNIRKINHFSQTLISINISSPLSAAEPIQNAIKIQQISSINQNKTQKKIPAKLIPMPITRWQQQNQNQQSKKQQINHQKHNNQIQNPLMFSFNNFENFATSNQLKSSKNLSSFVMISVQTQTEYFDLIQEYDKQPKIYQIPVEIDLNDGPSFNDASLQVSEQAFENSWNRIQNKVKSHQYVNFDNQITQNLLDNLQDFESNKQPLIRQQKNQEQQLRFTFNQSQKSKISNKNENFFNIPQHKTSLRIEKVYNQVFNFNKLQVNTNFNSANYLSDQLNNKQMLIQNQNYQQQQAEISLNQRDINRIKNNQSLNHIEEEQIQELKQRLFSLEQEKEENKQQLQNAMVTIASYKLIIQEKQQENQEKLKFQEQLQTLEQQLDNLNQLNLQLAEKNQDYLNQIQQFKKQQVQYQTNIMKQMHEKVVQLDKIQRELNIYKNQIQEKIQNDNSEAQQLKQIILTKNILIQDLKNQQILNKDLYESEITKLRKEIQRKQNKEDQIQEQKGMLEKKNLALVQKIKELNQQIQMYKLRLERIKTGDELNEEVKPSFGIQKLNKKVDIIIQQNDKKIQPPQNFKNQKTPNFKKQFSNVTKYPYSEVICQQSQYSQGSEPGNNFKGCQGIIRIQESPNHSKLTFQNSGWPFKQKSSKSNNQQNLFDQKLVKVIKVYEQTIQAQLSMIEQLQDRVFDYLKDGLIKQNEVELLYSQLCQYQNKMNQLLLQKLDIEFENQRLRKMIVDSQNKLGMLGNRLIRLAKTNSSASMALIQLKNKQQPDLHKISKSLYNQ